MFGSEVLDVGIGLVLVFLLASIIMTAAHEGIEAILQKRAAFLEQALVELMQGNTQALDGLYRHPLVFALYRGGTAGEGPDRPIKLPAYIPREVFSAALIDMVQTGEALPDRLRDAYEGLERLTGGDAGRLRREIEGWYDSTMDRASGRFKKHTQRTLFFLGLAVAVALNINAVTIAQYLNANDAQRLLVVGVAKGVSRPDTAVQPGAAGERRPAGTPATPAVDGPALQSRLAEIGLPIGWSSASQRWMESRGSAEPPALHALLIVAGWLITALATMLGAPFWFDLLNRLMVIRSTVKPKEKSPDEPSEDGGKAEKTVSSDVGARPPRGGGAAVGRGDRPDGAGGGGGGDLTTGPERDRVMSDAQPIYG